MPRRPASKSGLKAVADRAGVSTRAASYILNSPHADRFSPDTCARVRAAADSLGYRPSAAARSVRSGRFGSIAVIASTTSTSMPSGFLEGLHDGLLSEGLGLQLMRIGDADFANPDSAPRLMREHCCDGLVVMHELGTFPEAFQEGLNTLNLPAVWWNVDLPNDGVTPDDHAAGAQCAQRLIAAGHRRIAWSGPEIQHPVHSSAVARRDGCRSACRTAGIPLIEFTDPPAAPGREAQASIDRWREILSRSDAPAAIATYSPRQAVAIAQAALSLGRPFPGTPAVITCAHALDGDLGWWWSSAYLPWHAVGLVTADFLIRRLRSLKPLPSVRIPWESFPGHTL